MSRYSINNLFASYLIFQTAVSIF